MNEQTFKGGSVACLLHESEHMLANFDFFDLGFCLVDVNRDADGRIPPGPALIVGESDFFLFGVIALHIAMAKRPVFAFTVLDEDVVRRQ